MNLKETIKKYEKKCKSLKEEYDNLCQVRDWLIILDDIRENNKEMTEVIKPANRHLESDSIYATCDKSCPPSVTYHGIVNKYDLKEPIK